MCTLTQYLKQKHPIHCKPNTVNDNDVLSVENAALSAVIIQSEPDVWDSQQWFQDQPDNRKAAKPLYSLQYEGFNQTTSSHKSTQKNYREGTNIINIKYASA